MADRPFLAQSNKPNDESLQAALGPAYPDYRAILGQATAFARDWTFTRTDDGYSRSTIEVGDRAG